MTIKPNRSEDEALAMGGEDDLLRAIELMKNGDLQPAVALLQRAVDDPELDSHGRAVACIWLAETGDDLTFKISCLLHALRHEPGNIQIQRKLDELGASRTQQDADAPATASASAGIRLAQAPLVLGIDGGANGMGSGIFVNGAGIVATTAKVVGGALDVSVGWDGKQAVGAQVIRRYPESDLALIQTSVALDNPDALASASAVIADEAVTALAYNGAKIRGRAHDAGEGARRGWLRTSFLVAMSPDAGGNPLCDSRGQIIGLLTHNADHVTGRAWAISLSQILTLAEQSTQECRLLPRSTTCRSCGCRTSAGHYGGRYCETCGARLPSTVVRTADSPDIERLAQIYGEDQNRPCPNCAGKAGYYAGVCLRCSHVLANASAT